MTAGSLTPMGRLWAAGLISTRALTDHQVYNGLCECRGPLDRHPFHFEPLPPEYVGKHRDPEETK